MEVRNVGVDQENGSPVVILAARDGGRALPIWIGPAEAQAIALELQKVRPPRPLTHDLIKSILEGTKVTLRRVRITGLERQTYLAALVLDQAGREIEIDSRPSDAIALALRFACPILVHRTLLEGAAAFDLGRAQPATSHVLGLTVQDLDPAVADVLGYAGLEGVLIADVAPGDADVHGPRRGDLIVALDDEPVADVEALRARVADGGGPVWRLDLRRGSARLTVRYDPSARAGSRG